MHYYKSCFPFLNMILEPNSLILVFLNVKPPYYVIHVPVVRSWVCVCWLGGGGVVKSTLVEVIGCGFLIWS